LTTLRLPDERWGESQPARSQIPRLVLSNEVDAKGNAHVDDTALKQLVAAAQAGDEKALEAVVRAIQDDVFDLALRMLGEADDAHDAAQEVLTPAAA